MYKEITVWRRLVDAKAVRYRCLYCFKTDKYAVHNADIFSVGQDDGQFEYFDKIFLELFADDNPEERCDWFNTIEEAIEVHDDEFF